jgi:hypothetical protein
VAPPELAGEVRVKDAQVAAPAVMVKKLNQPLVLDLKGRGFTRLRARIASDASTLTSDIAPKVRVYAFAAEPQQKALSGAAGELPVPAPPVERDPAKLTALIFRHALSRDPSAKEREIALRMLSGTDKAAGLEDLLWSIALSPEFQYLR